MIAKRPIEHEQPRMTPEQCVAHYEALIAGDGITCSDLIVFGAELRKALRAKQEAEKDNVTTGS